MSAITPIDADLMIAAREYLERGVAELIAEKMMLQAKLDESRSRNMRLELCVSALLAVTKDYDDADVKSCREMVKVATGKVSVPVRERPELKLVVDHS